MEEEENIEDDISELLDIKDLNIESEGIIGLNILLKILYIYQIFVQCAKSPK